MGVDRGGNEPPDSLEEGEGSAVTDGDQLAPRAACRRWGRRMRSWRGRCHGWRCRWFCGRTAYRILIGEDETWAVWGGGPTAFCEATEATPPQADQAGSHVEVGGHSLADGRFDCVDTYVFIPR